MQDTASSSLEGIKDLISTTIGSRSKVDLEEAARRSSEEAALDRQESGINKSLTEEDKANEKTKRNLSGGIMSKYDADGVQPSSGKVTFDVPEHVVYTHPNQMSDFEILARTIEAEAAFEPYDGKIAVGSVIANRAASGKYGKGISGVILKKAQFSPWNSWTGGAKGEQGRDMLALKASEDSYKAARDILTGEYKDKTGGATHYVNESVSQPYWLDDMKGKKRGTKAIGNHLFGNADSNATYDGKSWISRKVDLTSSLRPPKERP
tara:strand:- start:45 stop:839 length:795 start_codon:yes stop_codon:yes gene_type:complete